MNGGPGDAPCLFGTVISIRCTTVIWRTEADVAILSKNFGINMNEQIDLEQGYRKLNQ